MLFQIKEASKPILLTEPEIIQVQAINDNLASQISQRNQQLLSLLQSPTDKVCEIAHIARTTQAQAQLTELQKATLVDKLKIAHNCLKCELSTDQKSLIPPKE